MYSNQSTSATFVSTRKKIGILEKQKRELTVSLSMFEYEIKRLKIKNRKLEEENRRLNGEIANQTASYVHDKRQLISDVQVSERNRYRNNESSMREQLQLLSKKIEEQDSLLKKQYKNNYVLSLKLNVAQAGLSKTRKSVEKYEKKYEKEVNARIFAEKQAKEYREQVTSLYDQKDSDELTIKGELNEKKKKILELERSARYEKQTFDRIKHELEEKMKIISHEKEVVQDQVKGLQKDHQEAVLQTVRLKREITEVQHSKSHLRTSLHQTMRKLKISNHEIRKLQNTVPSTSSFSRQKSTSSKINRSSSSSPSSSPISTSKSIDNNKLSSSQTTTLSLLSPIKKIEEETEGEESSSLESLEKIKKEYEETIKKLQKKIEEKESSSQDLLRKFNKQLNTLTEKRNEITDLNKQMKNVMYKNYCLQQKLSYQQKRNFKHYDLESLQINNLKQQKEIIRVNKQYQVSKNHISTLQKKINRLVSEKKKWSDQKVNISSELEREKYINQILRLKKVNNLMITKEEQEEEEKNINIQKQYQQQQQHQYQNISSQSINSGNNSKSSSSVVGNDDDENNNNNTSLYGYDHFEYQDLSITQKQLIKEKEELIKLVKKLMEEGNQFKNKISRLKLDLEDLKDQEKENQMKNSNIHRKCKMLMAKLKETLEANQMWKIKFSEIHQNIIRLKKILAKKHNIDLEKILLYFDQQKINQEEQLEQQQQQQQEQEEEEEEEEDNDDDDESNKENNEQINDTRQIVEKKMEMRKARINKKRNDVVRRKVIVLENNLINNENKNKKMMRSIKQLKKLVFKE